MTGRHPLRNGVWSNASTKLTTFGVDATGGLPPDEVTIATALKPLGYRTMAIGKWHLGQTHEHLPTAHGFDHYLGIPYCHNQCPCPANSRDFLECYNPPGVVVPLLPCPLLNGTTVIQQPTNMTALTSRYVGEATRFVSSSADDPFFLYMAWQHTHAWNFAGPDFWGKSRRGAYGDSVEEMDWAIGGVLDAVRASRHAANTFVIWTSDNGAAWPHRYAHAGSTGPLRCGKGTSWEGGVRVPAIFWWPGTLHAPIDGTASPLVASTLDVYPTIVSLAKEAARVNTLVTVDKVDKFDKLDKADQAAHASKAASAVLDGRDLSTFVRTGAALGENASLFWYAAETITATRVGEYKAVE